MALIRCPRAMMRAFICSVNMVAAGLLV